MAQLKNTNLTGNYIKIPTGSRSNRPATISRVSGLHDDILRPATNGMQLTVSSGTNWEKYQNLPSYLINLPSTTCINDGDTLSWTIPACKVYMIRQTSWNTVSTTGWTTVETGKNYITNVTTAVYSKEFSAGTYTFDNNSAMYLFETAEKGTMRWNTDYNEFEVFNGYDWLTESMTPGLPVTRGMNSLWDAGDDFTQGAYNTDYMSCLDRTSSKVHIYHSNSSASQASNNDIRTRIDDVLCWDCESSSSYYMRNQSTTVTFGPRHTMWCWAWCRSSTANWRTLWRGSNDRPIIIQSGTDNIGFYDNRTGGGFRDTGSDITGLTESWRMWTITADGSGNSEIYLDDASVGTVDRSTAGDQFLAFGNYQGGSQNFGYVAMAAIYNTDLSADEVKKSFDATKHKFGRT